MCTTHCVAVSSHFPWISQTKPDFFSLIDRKLTDNWKDLFWWPSFTLPQLHSPFLTFISTKVLLRSLMCCWSCATRFASSNRPTSRYIAHWFNSDFNCEGERIFNLLDIHVCFCVTASVGLSVLHVLQPTRISVVGTSHTGSTRISTAKGYSISLTCMNLSYVLLLYVCKSICLYLSVCWSVCPSRSPTDPRLISDFSCESERIFNLHAMYVSLLFVPSPCLYVM